MEGKPTKKISFLTIKQVRAYRVWCLILITVLSLLMLISLYLVFMRRSYTIGFLFAALVVYRLYSIYKKIKAVEFDEGYLYVTEKGYDIVVPLENIKTVEIKSLNGIYKISFFDMIQSGKSLFFKPSLLYPLDFSKQNKKVNLLRSLSWTARQRRNPMSPNRLQS